MATGDRSLKATYCFQTFPYRKRHLQQPLFRSTLITPAWIFLEKFQATRRIAHHSDSFFPAEHEYLSHFFQHVKVSPNFILIV